MNLGSAMGNLSDLAGRLGKRGFLAAPAATKAFLSVDPAEFVPAPYRRLAYEDTPVPFHTGEAVGLLPSRRLVATLLQLANLEGDGLRILYGSDGGYLATLLAQPSPAPSLVVVEPEESLARITAANLRRVGQPNVRVEREMPSELASWICVLRPEADVDADLRMHLDDMGTLLTPRKGPKGHELVQIVRNGDEFGNSPFARRPSATREPESIP